MEPKAVPVNTGSGGDLLDFSWLSILQSQLPDQQLPKLPGNNLQLAKIELGSFSTKVSSEDSYSGLKIEPNFLQVPKMALDFNKFKFLATQKLISLGSQKQAIFTTNA